MPDLAAMLIIALFLALAMAGAFVLQDRTNQSGWIDTIWSFATGIAAIGLILGTTDVGGDPGRRATVLALVALWAARLGTHIARRTRGGGDDPRYAALKRDWGSSARRRMAVFLQIQALCAVPLALAVALAANRPGAFPTIQDGLGLGLVAAGIYGETCADRQLAAFRRAGSGEHARSGGICQTGLWARSRHPNYFFEWLGWCGWPILALDPGGGYWQGAFALVAPVLIYWLLVHASGIPPLEAHMLCSRGEAYRAYQQRVPAFFPALRLKSPDTA
jgi:steroid 5-alpha reductase family enzyme